jgi:ribosomal protein S27AE
MSELKGTCPNCGLHYHGRALSTRHNQLCVRCGSSLEMTEDGMLVRYGFPPFNEGEYPLDSGQDEWEEPRDEHNIFYLARN